MDAQRYLLPTLDTSVLELLAPSVDNTKFPGALPKGLRCTSLNYIFDTDNRSKYVATAKLDGVRFLAIFCCDGVFLVNRKMEVFHAVDTKLSLDGIHCVIDGELMDNNHFYAFDAMIINGTSISHDPFGARYRQLCLFLEQMVIPGPVRFVPKRMHPIVEMSALLGVDQTNSIPARDVVHEHWAESVDGTLLVDGIIFMDQTDTFLFHNAFGLVKWKQTATVDVLIDMKDLCTHNGDPRRADHVQTYYWEYSVRLGKSTRVPFAICHTSPAERVALWCERMQRQRSSMVCVECFRDPAGWHILRGRPEKNRSNSARTIMDTVWIDQEQITIVDIEQAFSRSSPSLTTVDLSPLQSLCGSLSWLGYTWAQATDICELELRLTQAGTSSLSASMFHRIVKRLQMSESMIKSEILSSDYTCGSVRVTSTGETSYAIQKEVGHRADLLLPDMPPLGMQCTLSYEHPSPSLDMEAVGARYTTCRQKRRWRFVHRETVAIDCTYVQTTDCRDNTVSVDSYEVEIELLRKTRYSDLSYHACSGLILSMVWRMLMYVLGVSVETTNIQAN